MLVVTFDDVVVFDFFTTMVEACSKWDKGKKFEILLIYRNNYSLEQLKDLELVKYSLIGKLDVTNAFGITKYKWWMVIFVSSITTRNANGDEHDHLLQFEFSN